MAEGLKRAALRYDRQILGEVPDWKGVKTAKTIRSGAAKYPAAALTTGQDQCLGVMRFCILVCCGKAQAPGRCVRQTLSIPGWTCLAISGLAVLQAV